MMKKLLLTALTLALIAAGTTVVLAAVGNGSHAPTTVDVSGPCDEAEHANDPACAGGGAGQADDDPAGDDRGRGRDHAEDDGTAGDAPVSVAGDDNPSADDLSGVDVSGNCDEDEHAADPECQDAGATTTTPVADDDSGELDDNSGPSENSGPGSVSSGSDDSFDDDSGDDSSGPGSGDAGSGDSGGSSGEGGDDD